MEIRLLPESMKLLYLWGPAHCLQILDRGSHQRAKEWARAAMYITCMTAVLLEDQKRLWAHGFVILLVRVALLAAAVCGGGNLPPRGSSNRITCRATQRRLHPHICTWPVRLRLISNLWRAEHSLWSARNRNSNIPTDNERQDSALTSYVLIQSSTRGESGGGACICCLPTGPILSLIKLLQIYACSLTDALLYAVSCDHLQYVGIYVYVWTY